MMNTTKGYSSINRLSYQPIRKVDVDVEILDPYKSHTTLSWIGCHKTDYSRDWSINNLPFPPSFVNILYSKTKIQHIMYIYKQKKCQNKKKRW